MAFVSGKVAKVAKVANFFAIPPSQNLVTFRAECTETTSVGGGAGLTGSCGGGCVGRGAGAPGNGFGTGFCAGVCWASNAATSSAGTESISGIIRARLVFSWVELKYEYA